MNQPAKLMDHHVPPSNIEIEESILAGCIMFDEIRADALTLLDAADFYRGAHQVLFKTVSAMADAGMPVDLLSIVDRLKTKGHLETVGGAVAVAKICDTPIPSSVAAYADRLKRYAQLRQVIQICGTTMAACHQGDIDDMEDLLNKFQTEALTVGEKLRSSWLTKAELSEQSVDRYQDLNDGAAHRSLPTGFPTLDRITGGGFRGPKLVIVAARPRVGKTALMCNMIENMCSRGIAAGCFSLEMAAEELDDRWLASGAHVNSMRLTAEPGPDSKEWERLFRAADKQSKWKLFVDDNPADIASLKRRIRQMHKAGAQIIFIDQLSGIGGNKKKDVFERNTEHVEELKFLKKELRIPIVLLAQLNRELEKRSNKKPILSDLKNTGQLEEDADIVIMGHRPYLYADANGKRDESLSNYAEWEVTKNRQGAEWNIKMNWQEKFQVFTEKIEFDGRK